MASTKAIKGGDRVRFVDDERLDIPDTLSLQELGYDYISDLAGAVIGSTKASGATLPVGGTMSKLVFDTSTPSATKIYGPDGASTSKAMFLYSYLNQSGYSEVQTLVYNPAASGQQTTIDLSSYSAGSTPYVWAKRVDVNTDVDTRKKWDVSGNQEITTSLATRERYRVQFTVTSSSSPPSSDVGWFCIAKCVSIVGSAYSFRMVHPFDCGKEPTANGALDWDNSVAPWSWSLSSAAGPFVGMARALLALQQELRGSYNTLYSAIQANDADISSLDTRVDTAETNIETLNDSVISISTILGREMPPVTRFQLRADGAGAWVTSNVLSSQVIGASYLSASDITVTPDFNGWRILIELPAGAEFWTCVVQLARDTPTGSSLVTPSPYVVGVTLGEPTLIVGRRQLMLWLNTYQNISTTNNFAVFPSGNPTQYTTVIINLYKSPQ